MFIKTFSSGFKKLLLVACLIPGFLNNIMAQDARKTVKQTELSMKEKKLQTENEQKIDSRLLQGIKEHQGIKSKNPDLEPVKIAMDKDGMVVLDIDALVSDTLLNNIRTLGGTIVSSFKQYNKIRIKVKLSEIGEISGYRAVKFIKQAAVPQTNRRRVINETSTEP